MTYVCSSIFKILYKSHLISLFFFLNDTPPTEISSLPLHDALPILLIVRRVKASCHPTSERRFVVRGPGEHRRKRSSVTVVQPVHRGHDEAGIESAAQKRSDKIGRAHV